jgi:hypothetical protein
VGSDGYRLAAESTCTDGVILEVGAGVSTKHLATMGPLVTTIDLEHQPMLGLPRCRYLTGRAEEVLTRWHESGVGDGRLVCFAWLDGHDWPYDDLPPDMMGRQAAEYEAAGLELSKDASRHSRLTIAALLAPWVAVGGIVAFDDTWQTTGGFDGKGGAAVPWLLGTRPGRTSGRRFELWRTQDDTEPWHNGYVAVRRTR